MPDILCQCVKRSRASQNHARKCGAHSGSPKLCASSGCAGQTMEVGVYQWFALSALSLLVHDLNPSSSLETDPISLSLAAVEDAYEWIAWKQEHQRNYSSNLQELERYIVWRSNKFYVRQHNSHSDDFGYTLKMNQFGDMVSAGELWTIIHCY